MTGLQVSQLAGCRLQVMFSNLSTFNLQLSTFQPFNLQPYKGYNKVPIVLPLETGS
jgi:hypothetical protein